MKYSNPLTVSLYPLGPFSTKSASTNFPKNCRAVGEVTFILHATSLTLAGQPLKEREWTASMQSKSLLLTPETDLGFT